MKPRHPITCLDTRPTPTAEREAFERRAYALRLALITTFALGLILAVATR